MGSKPVEEGKTPSGVEWRRMRRLVEVLEHRCVYCGDWFPVKRPDTEPKTCSKSCRVMLSRRRKREAGQ